MILNIHGFFTTDEFILIHHFLTSLFFFLLFFLCSECFCGVVAGEGGVRKPRETRACVAARTTES